MYVVQSIDPFRDSAHLDAFTRTNMCATLNHFSLKADAKSITDDSGLCGARLAGEVRCDLKDAIREGFGFQYVTIAVYQRKLMRLTMTTQCTYP